MRAQFQMQQSPEYPIAVCFCRIWKMVVSVGGPRTVQGERILGQAGISIVVVQDRRAVSTKGALDV